MTEAQPSAELIVAADDPTAVVRAVAELAAGRSIIIPTDTVYGLAAPADDAEAVAQLFAIKRRPADLSIAALVSGPDQARTHVDLTAVEDLVARWWPGALTVVVPKLADSLLAVGAADGTLGVRAPASEFARALAAEVGPVAATSANRSGTPTLQTAAELAAEFAGEVALIIDAGPLTAPASTVVRVNAEGVEVLRAGGVDVDAPLDQPGNSGSSFS